MKHSFPTRILASVAAAALLAGCTVHKQEVPELSGPSEFGTSISVTVTPDVLTQDGASQSLITVTARDANAQPLRNVSLRAEIEVDGVHVDFGSLSARNLLTGTDGRATALYTAPAAPPVTVDNFTIVTIAITPVGSDFNNTTIRTAAIRLVPPGIVIPPDGLKPSFTFTPSAPLDHQNVLFDASASQPAGGIVEYRWSFGDGESKTGKTVTHDYDMPGTYTVTLTISDSYGRTASTSQSLTVGAGVNPTAAFVFSPSAPVPGQQINFNAAQSRPAPGRTIVSYSWNFGDGGTASGQQASHTFSLAGTYNVVLVVTDDAGRVGTATQAVAVSTGAPTADFTFSPTAPTAGATVSFNASASTVAVGRTIASYFWTWGDTSAPGSGATPTHQFTTPGSYNVTLTVTDSQGQSASVTKTVNVL